MLEDETMQSTMEQLVGIQEEKPFECVGSRDEINTALVMTIDRLEKDGEKLPYLLKYYKTTGLYEEYKAKGDHSPDILMSRTWFQQPGKELVRKNCKSQEREEEA